MQIVAVLGGSFADRRGLARRLAAVLADRGRVAVVDAGSDQDGSTAIDSGSEGPVSQGPISQGPGSDGTGVDGVGSDAATTVSLAEGVWREDGAIAVETALERLAPDHDYAVVSGVAVARAPTVYLGERAQRTGPGEAHDGSSSTGDERGTKPDGADLNVIARGTDPDAVDASALVDDLQDAAPFVTRSELVADVKTDPDADRAGAIATFTGRVRRRDGPEDEPTEHLYFEKYDGVADERLADLRADLEARDGVHAVRLHHRTGTVEAGEDIVFVVVLAGHREEAFAAVSDGIDRLKDEVPLFKKEVTVDDEYWRHDEPGS